MSFGSATETIVLNPISMLLQNQNILQEGNIVSLNLSFTPTGGTFRINFLRGAVPFPPEDFVVQLPFGRFAVVRGITRSQSREGLIDSISGPILPLVATLVNFVGYVYNVNTFSADMARALCQGTVIWEAYNPLVRGFTFRGIALSGIQQLAGNMLAEVYVYKNTIYVMPPGQAVADLIGAPKITIPSTDIVSLSQDIDYSSDVASVLNPILNVINFNNPGDFVYDGDHAIKQPNTFVQCGSPKGSGGTDFIEIPNGWMVDGVYEEWVPNGTDLTNPSASVTRYWKTFPSPTLPGYMRGIISFTRLVKDLSLPGNVSTFVGTPITSQTNAGSKSSPARTFAIQESSTDPTAGVFGFTADNTVISDIVSGGVAVNIDTALQLIPQGGSSGTADVNFFAIQLGLWTFPRVLPTTYNVQNPVNPFNLPPNVVVVNPPIQNPRQPVYFTSYFQNYQKINSPRLRTQVSYIYRNALPQPGDHLIVPGADTTDCGRISNVTLNLTRSGVLVSVTAEQYQFAPGKWSLGGAGTTVAK
jgi:hypothetical protein